MSKNIREGLKKKKKWPVFVVSDYGGGGRGPAKMRKDYEALL